jgi:hypothetical protein
MADQPEEDPSTAGAPSEPPSSHSAQTEQRSTVENELRTGDYQAAGLPMSSAQRPQVVKMTDTGRLALVKVAYGAIPQDDDMVRNEASYYEVSKGVGSELVPVTVTRTVEAHGRKFVSSFQEFHTDTEDHPPLTSLPDEVISEAAALDIAAGQLDRLDHNWLIGDVDGVPRLWLIDNACTFDFTPNNERLRAQNPNGEPQSAMIEEARARGIAPSSDVMEALLDPAGTAWDGAASLTPVQIAKARDRIRKTLALTA